jgi:hypothetical protein
VGRDRLSADVGPDPHCCSPVASARIIFAPRWLGERIMRFCYPTAALATLLLAGWPAAALDFDKIDRHITKEPTYKGKPLYGLALLGADAKTRVWMVLDGERLYVDRNCNGDLTDDGPPTELKDRNTDPGSFPLIDVSPDGGKSVYKFDVALYNRPSSRPKLNDEPYNQTVHVTFPDGRWYGAWGDHLQPLIFAAAPKEAPVLHVGGELRMGFEIRNPLAREPGGLTLFACVGTPGSCPGAWVHLMYRTIPKDVHPSVVMELPPKKSGGPPVRVKFVLKERC